VATISDFAAKNQSCHIPLDLTICTLLDIIRLGLFGHQTRIPLEQVLKPTFSVFVPLVSLKGPLAYSQKPKTVESTPVLTL
jgi:hypothetical protein